MFLKTSIIPLCSGVQLKEALQLQLDVQRRLHEQLEVAEMLLYKHKFQLQMYEMNKKGHW